MVSFDIYTKVLIHSRAVRFPELHPKYMTRMSAVVSFPDLLDHRPQRNELLIGDDICAIMETFSVNADGWSVPLILPDYTHKPFQGKIKFTVRGRKTFKAPLFESKSLCSI